MATSSISAPASWDRTTGLPASRSSSCTTTSEARCSSSTTPAACCHTKSTSRPAAAATERCRAAREHRSATASRARNWTVKTDCTTLGPATSRPGLAVGRAQSRSSGRAVGTATRPTNRRGTWTRTVASRGCRSGRTWRSGRRSTSSWSASSRGASNCAATTPSRSAKWGRGAPGSGPTTSAAKAARTGGAGQRVSAREGELPAPFIRRQVGHAGGRPAGRGPVASPAGGAAVR
jgi:hypothetical protein